MKQETVSGSGISWAICKSAPRSREITTPAPHDSVFYRPDALPAAQPAASKHWRQSKALTVLNTQQYNHNCHHCVTSTLLGSVIIMCLCLSINWHISKKHTPKLHEIFCVHCTGRVTIPSPSNSMKAVAFAHNGLFLKYPPLLLQLLFWRSGLTFRSYCSLG